MNDPHDDNTDATAAAGADLEESTGTESAEKGKRTKASADEISNLIIRQAEEAGLTLKKDGVEISNYIAERASVLAAGFGERGYLEALRVERDNIALFAATEAVKTADEIDQRVLAVINGGLSVAVRLIAAV